MLEIWKKFTRLADFLSKCGLAVASVFILAMVLIVSADIIVRTFYSGAGLNATEYSGYMMVFVVFAGVAFSFRNGSFIRVEILDNKIPQKFRRMLACILSFIALVYVIILSIYIWKMIILSYTSGARSNDVSQWPLYWPQSIMGIGSIILVLQLMAHFGNLLLNVAGQEEEKEAHQLCHGE